MKVFSYTQWQYNLLNTGNTSTRLECRSCAEEINIGYVIAHDLSEVDAQIDTDTGQQCSSCLAMFLSTTNWTVEPPKITIVKQRGE